MHNITIRYVGLIRNALGKQEELLAIAEGSTLRDVLALLSDTYGEDFRSILFGADGRLRQTTSLLLDGVDITEMRGIDTSLMGTAKVTILALVHPPAGG